MGYRECGRAGPGPTTTGRPPPASWSASPPRGLPAGPRQVGGLPAPGGQAGGLSSCPRTVGSPPVHPAACSIARGACVHPEGQGREAARGEDLGGHSSQQAAQQGCLSVCPSVQADVLFLAGHLRPRTLARLLAMNPSPLGLAQRCHPSWTWTGGEQDPPHSPSSSWPPGVWLGPRRDPLWPRGERTWCGQWLGLHPLARKGQVEEGR